MTPLQVASNMPANGYRIVHPLDDATEQKFSSVGLGPIHMTRSVRISLAVLRAYLLAMTAMLVYHVLHLSGMAVKLR